MPQIAFTKRLAFGFEEFKAFVPINWRLRYMICRGGLLAQLLSPVLPVAKEEG